MFCATICLISNGTTYLLSYIPFVLVKSNVLCIQVDILINIKTYLYIYVDKKKLYENATGYEQRMLNVSLLTTIFITF